MSDFSPFHNTVKSLAFTLLQMVFIHMTIISEVMLVPTNCLDVVVDVRKENVLIYTQKYKGF